LTPCCGLEEQKLTQALQSIKGAGTTFDWDPKWIRTLPSIKYCSWDIHGGISLNIPWQYIKDRKMLVHLGLISKVLPASLTDWSIWVGFYTSSSQQGVKYQLDIWIFICGGVSRPQVD
jgi:hypothetical protein